MLFGRYVDELLEILKRNGIGYYLGHHYVDDIILFCHTVAGLRKRITICEEYAKEHNILFSGNNIKYLIFGGYKYKHVIRVNNMTVPRCDSAIYLGHL